MPLSVEYGPAAPPGETRPRRAPGYDELIGIPYIDEPEVNTCSMCLKRAATKFGDRNFLGHRAYLADGERGDYLWQTFKEVSADVTNIGKGLKGLVKLDATNAAAGVAQPRLGIYAINRPEWTKTLLSAFSQRIAVAPMYDTLGPKACTYIIEHAELTAVCCERSKLASLIQGKAPVLKFIILMESDASEAERKSVKDAGLTLFTLEELIKYGTDNPTATELLPKPEDWAYVMYTSGTTGDPKGVILTHQNILASSSALLLQNKDIKLLREDDVYISYLPLAHSFETCMQVDCIIVGCAVGFYQGSPAKMISDDLPTLRPTVMAGVPRIYSRIYDKVTQGIDAKGGIAKLLFGWGMQAKWSKFIFDAILFKKVKAVLGGRVRLFASGAAPLSAELHGFLRHVFGCPVLQGYGMTENCAAAVVMPWGYEVGGNVGGPIPCTEVKLMNTDDYKVTDVYPASLEAFEGQVSWKGQFRSDLAGQVIPRGEICLRGLNVFQGYFKNEQETKETLDEQGWLHTGDIGMWNQDGSLSITDRKKNIFKLAQGEYVSPEACEIAIGASKYAGQVWVYGNSFENYVVAIVVPDQDVMKKWAKDNGKAGVSMQELVKDPEVKKMIMADLIATGKAAKLRGFELPKEIDFETTVNDLGQGFTVDQDTLTPTMKLRRPQLQRMYQKQIDVMYVKIKAMEVAAAKKANV